MNKVKDTLVKAFICEGRVRVYLATTTHLVDEARIRHKMWATSAAALGRTLTVGAIMSGMLKDENEKQTIEINGGGPIGTILVDVFPGGKVRGFVSDPAILLVNNKNGKLAVGQAVGTNGYLRVIKDISLKDDYTGTVALQSGEIGEDFAYYFTVSEQTPTAVSVGVLVGDDGRIASAGGLIIQVLPDAKEEDIVYCEQLLAKLKPISALVKEEGDAEKLIHQIFEEVEVLETMPLKFHCGCSKHHMSEALTTIDESELEVMIKEDHGCEITCNFCGNIYRFTEEELQKILDDKRKLS